MPRRCTYSPSTMSWIRCKNCETAGTDNAEPGYALNWKKVNMRVLYWPNYCCCSDIRTLPDNVGMCVARSNSKTVNLTAVTDCASPWCTVTFVHSSAPSRNWRSVYESLPSFPAPITCCNNIQRSDTAGDWRGGKLSAFSAHIKVIFCLYYTMAQSVSLESLNFRLLRA